MNYKTQIINQIVVAGHINIAGKCSKYYEGELRLLRRRRESIKSGNELILIIHHQFDATFLTDGALVFEYERE